MKKILLFLGMFLFMFNVSALTFDVDITNIEDEGNNGTIGSITDIDLENRTINAYFQDIGDEVSFSITVTNTGDRAGTLRSIEFTGTNDKLEYTSDLPDGGLAINGNDTNKVTITAKVKEGAVNGTTSSVININYSYDEGSCPDGEILSDDESMCLCPEGMERNETGICVKPIKPTDCAKDEIYNETKKICEKKVVPVNPSNPKTLDNIILVTLLFMVSGLGIYAVMFKKLKTNKKKVAAGIITGVLTLSLSFTVLASVFGLDKLLAAIINPITKSKTLTLTVNEEFDLIETWDGECSLEVSELTPDKIFQGGSGTESDPYQIKTAEQLSCFVKSINNGTTYEGKFVQQIKNIKLNDKVLDNVEAGTTTGLNTWIPAGEVDDTSSTPIIKSFNGTYDGDYHVISGLYMNNSSETYLGLFRATSGATIKNLTLSDNYINGDKYIGTLIGLSGTNTKIDSVKTYGTLIGTRDVAGIVGTSMDAANVTDYTRIESSKNYATITAGGSASGIGMRYNIIIETENYGTVTAINDVSGICMYSCYIIDTENHGEVVGQTNVVGISAAPSYMFGTDNYGKITGRIIDNSVEYTGNYVGLAISGSVYDCNNYGDIEATTGYYAVGVAVSGSRVYNSGNTGIINAHDYVSDYTSTIYFSPLLASGSNIISESDLETDSNLQKYHDIMGKDFVAENTNNYNTGDVYVSNVTAPGFGVTMVGNSGVGSVSNVTTEGNMYISNVTATANSSTFTRIATDGGNYRNVTSVGDIIIDNFNTEKELYVTGVGCSGTSVYNSSSEGDIEVKNSSAGGRYCYDEDGYTWCSESYAYITGGTTSGAYMENSYTKGEIKVHDSSFILDLHVGGVTASGSGATRSYNEKSLEVYNNTGKNLYVGGLGTAGGRGVTDGYNTGDINVYDNTFDAMRVAGGPAGEMFQSGGIYNTGNVYVKDNQASSIQLGGAVSWNYFGNYYNTGNITFETENNTKLTTLEVGGINVRSHGDSGSNLVYTGDITIPYVPSVTKLAVGGIYADLNNSPSAYTYFSGNINVGEGYTYSDTINFGNIYGLKSSVYDASSDTPTSYYTNDGYAMGLSRLNSSYAALDANYGIKINASQVPSILNIINVNNAFELKEGETLPTLKVFNQ